MLSGEPPSQPHYHVAAAQSGLWKSLALQIYCCAQEFLVPPSSGRLGDSCLDWEENRGYLDLQMR